MRSEPAQRMSSHHRLVVSALLGLALGVAALVVAFLVVTVDEDVACASLGGQQYCYPAEKYTITTVHDDGFGVCQISKINPGTLEKCDWVTFDPCGDPPRNGFRHPPDDQWDGIGCGL